MAGKGGREPTEVAGQGKVYGGPGLGGPWYYKKDDSVKGGRRSMSVEEVRKYRKRLKMQRAIEQNRNNASQE